MDKMMEKPCEASQVTLAHIAQPQDANPAGNMHGGVIMKLIDDAAAVVALRHARTNVVTASIDRLDFHSPVMVGNLVLLRASVNYVGKSSMEIGVRVECEDLFSGVVRHMASAYLTYVSLDENGRPMPVPPIRPESEEEKRRFSDAQQRRQKRLASRKAK